MKSTLSSDGKPIVQLPSLTIEKHDVELSETERDFYNALYTRSKTEFEGYVSRGTVLSNYAHILEVFIEFVLYILIISSSFIIIVNLVY